MRALLLAALLLQDASDFDVLKTRFEAEKDKPPAQRAETVGAIVALKTDPAGEFLIEIFDREKDAGLRSLALQGIAAWAAPAGLQKLAAVGGDAKQPLSFRALSIDAITQPPSKEGLAVAKAVARERGEI